LQERKQRVVFGVQWHDILWLHTTGISMGFHLFVLYITVSHGSAYTVVRATQQVNGKGQFWGVRLESCTGTTFYPHPHPIPVHIFPTFFVHVHEKYLYLAKMRISVQYTDKKENPKLQ